MKTIFTAAVMSLCVLISATTMAADMPALAKKNNCVACHAIDKKMVGPAWTDVAHKYKGAKKFSFEGKEYPLEQGLILKVSKGGKGNWGTMPMPPNDAAGNKQADIKELVKFILGLAK
jgi:cytochrome c551/c552